MTEKQKQVLIVINDYVKKEGISPTIREICDIAEIKSTSTVHGYIKRLEKQGYIKMIKDSPRSIRVIKMT